MPIVHSPHQSGTHFENRTLKNIAGGNARHGLGIMIGTTGALSAS
jgi:hypothetical protein